MSEKEKMLAGEPYNPADPELLQRYLRARKLVQEYNAADCSDSESIERILAELVGSRGRNVWITAPFYVDYGENIHIGNNVEINMNCVFLDCNRITIGDNSGIGPNVQIYAVGHPVDPTERLRPDADGVLSAWNTVSAPVTIGSNVWIGGGSIILPGVEIGDNTTVGAGSVVTKSLPPNCLAVGHPCKVVRRL